MQYIHVDSNDAHSTVSVRHMPRPVCGDKQLLIKVFSAGVNRPDLFQRKGLYPPPPGASGVLGLEVAGVVEETGCNVSGWHSGDRVCALTNGGGYAEYVAVDAGQCLPIPSPLSYVQASALPEACFTVWFNLFQRAKLSKGESLLIHGGSSGIGTTAIQMAKNAGVSVYVTAGSEEKCRFCESLGALKAVNYNEQDFYQVLHKETQGKGVDVVLDMVGGDYIGKNVKLAAINGRIINIAFLAGSEVNLDFMMLMLKGVQISGSVLRPQSESIKAEIALELLEHVWPLFERERIKPVIAAEFPLSQVERAHALMESRQHIGKIILTVDGD